MTETVTRKFSSKTGRSITFMNEADWRHSYELKNILVQSNQTIPPWLLELKHMKITEQLNTEYDEMKVNCGRKNRRFTKAKHWGSFNRSQQEDFDYFDDGGGDFFEEYHRKCEKEKTPNDLNNINEVKESNTTECSDDKLHLKCVEEEVIEYRSDLFHEFYDREDEDGYFDHYQQEIDAQTEKKQVEIIDTDEMDYFESDENNGDWW